MGLLKKAAVLAGLAAAAEGLGTAYFYRRTMIRTNAKPERSAKMSGIDWSQYYPRMHENRDWLLQQPHEEVGILSHDGLKLHGTYFPGPATKWSSASTATPATVWASTPAWPGAL